MCDEHVWGYQAQSAGGDLIDDVPANSISTFGGNPLATAGALANLP